MAAGFEAKYRSAVHGHHICRDIWTSTIGDSEVLMCKLKEENERDRFAVG